MGETVIYIRATRAAVRQVIARIPETARANGSIANAMMTRVGLTALGHIKQAFIVKARGGTDEAGESWKPLKRSTIAYGRRHPGVLWPGRLRAPYAPSWMLTAQQRDRWWELYRRFGGMAPSGAAYHARGVNRGHAAAAAWVILKREGAKTLIGEYGDTEVDILRDTGLLLNSLSPGVQSAEQVFRVGLGEIIIGTNRKWASVHHRGSSDGRIPQRRLWPEPEKWPSSWWIDILEQLQLGMIEIAIQLIGGAK